jgi:hypothetical protein
MLKTKGAASVVESAGGRRKNDAGEHTSNTQAKPAPQGTHGLPHANRSAS